jgi:adenylate cyclase
MPAVDYESAGLLEGLEGDDRAARERLLDRLVEEGFTQKELEEAVREDRLPLLLVERVLGGRYSARELEQRTGLEAAQMLRIRRLLGLPEASPDDPVFGEQEVDAAHSTRLFLDVGLGEDAIAEITRVLGEGMHGWPPPPPRRSSTRS